MLTRNFYDKYIYPLLLIVVLMSFSSCEKTQSLPDYYFPDPGEGKGYVYHFKSVDGDLPDEFWHIRRGSKNELVICIMDEYRGWRQCSYEYIATNGILQENLLVFNDSLGNMEIEVVHGNLYPREPSDPERVYIQYLRWYTSPDSSTYTQIIRNRRYTPHSTKATRLGDRFVLFEIKESLEDYQEGYLELDAKGLEVFEQGVGLVYFEREHSGQFSQRFSFETKMTVDEFNKYTGWDVLDRK